MGKRIAYLRKSRVDLELEKTMNIDTLSRHREIIKQTALNNEVVIDCWLEEVVSGETIEARPKIQELLREVESGNVDEVFVVDIDRLARGDTADQGRISKAFQFSNTKIVTPVKIYDPNNEFDEDFFEFGLFMSRREYKIINKRLNRGRLSSVNEGKFVGSVCPYGYSKEKLQGQKGYKLIPLESEAKIVKIIFQKACEKLGSQNIANYLNKIGVKPRKSNEWSYSTIRDIIQNPVYYGMIKWNWRKVEKKMINGVVYKSRPKHKDYILVEGLHEALITKEVYDFANNNLKQKNSNFVRNDEEIQNPLMGLITCSICGRTMQRRNYRSGHIDGLVCPRPHCKNVGSHLYLVEQKIVDSLKDILKEYNSIIENFNNDDTIVNSTNEEIIGIINREIDKLENQLNKAYDLLEQGIYDSNTFLERTKLLKRQIEKLKDEKKKNSISSKTEKIEKIKDVIPNIEYALKTYNKDLSPEDKNNLLKNIIDHVEYLKYKKGRGHEDEFTLKIKVKL